VESVYAKSQLSSFKTVGADRGDTRQMDNNPLPWENVSVMKNLILHLLLLMEDKFRLIIVAIESF